MSVAAPLGTGVGDVTVSRSTPEARPRSIGFLRPGSASDGHGPSLRRRFQSVVEEGRQGLEAKIAVALHGGKPGPDRESKAHALLLGPGSKWSTVDRSDIERIRALPVGRSGRRDPGWEAGSRMRVPLTMVASVEVAFGPAQISRERLQRRISVPASVRGRDVQSVVDASNAAVDRQVMLLPHYSLVWSGHFQHLQETTARLAGLISPDVPMAAAWASWR